MDASHGFSVRAHMMFVPVMKHSSDESCCGESIGQHFVLKPCPAIVLQDLSLRVVLKEANVADVRCKTS